jgi:hypothetical protein
MSTFIDFEMTDVAPCDHVLKLRVRGGTLHVTVEVTGADGLDFDGACVVLVPQVDYLPEGWSIDDARAAAAEDLRSRKPWGWGVPHELRAAIRSGAASLEMPGTRAA